MFAFKNPRVLLLLLILLLHYCSKGVWSSEDDGSSAGIIFYNLKKLIKKAFAPEDEVSAGQKVFLGEFAHMAAIGWSQYDGTIDWQCGGSLIWENYVLTAAHCAEDNNNYSPDVARFGDLDLYDDADNYYLQQRKIVEIIRHPNHRFSRRYHDLALMRLESKVRINMYVTPACLWNEDEIRFKKLQAAGWGDTRFAGEQSPHLLKVSVSPVDLEVCSKYYPDKRRIPDGLLPYQMCAGDAIMDTCPGDSGGPLEVKMLHQYFAYPFVVAVTSFGAACGQSSPAIYTRVAPYIPWIRSVLNERGESVTEEIFEPGACAARKYTNAFFRRHVRHTYMRSYDVRVHKVSIHWRKRLSKKQPKCYGVIIDETTIVTLALCTELDGIPPSYIRYKGNQRNTITNSFRHPQYQENSAYNNIGLLKLKHPFEFSNYFRPANIWTKKYLPVKMQIMGQGLAYEGGSFFRTKSNANQTTAVQYTVNVHNGPKCSIKGLTEEHLCFGDDRYLIPGSCFLSPGEPIKDNRDYNTPHAQLDYVYALNLFSRDCGFGESGLGVKIGYHSEWIQSVLRPHHW